MNKDPWCLCHDGESCSRHGVMPFAVRLPTWLCVEIELMAIECLVSNLMWLLNDTHRGIVWRAWRLLSYKIRAQCCGLTCINKLNEILTTGVYRCAFVSDSIYLISRQFMSALSSLFKDTKATYFSFSCWIILEPMGVRNIGWHSRLTVYTKRSTDLNCDWRRTPPSLR